jgi:hypothetical protein
MSMPFLLTNVCLKIFLAISIDFVPLIRIMVMPLCPISVIGANIVDENILNVILKYP